MTIDLKTLDELERLSNEATGRRWHIGHVSEFDESASVDSEDGTTVAVSEFRKDQSFICASRNALPDLIQAIRKMREALEFYSKGGNCSMDRWEHPELGSFIGKRARTCLKELGLE